MAQKYSLANFLCRFRPSANFKAYLSILFCFAFFSIKETQYIKSTAFQSFIILIFFFFHFLYFFPSSIIQGISTRFTLKIEPIFSSQVLITKRFLNGQKLKIFKCLKLSNSYSLNFYAQYFLKFFLLFCNVMALQCY